MTASYSLVAVFLACLLAPHVCQGAACERYVSVAAGTDNSTCGATANAPCKSIGYLFSNIALCAEVQVSIAAGTYEGNANQGLSVALNDVKAVLQGSGSESVFWNGENTQSLAVFTLSGGTATVKMSGITFQNGYSDVDLAPSLIGVRIAADTGVATFSDCVFDGYTTSSATDGAALLVGASDDANESIVELTQVSFLNGEDASALQLPRCDIALLQSCTFASKQSFNFFGVGGISADSVGQLVIVNTTFDGMGGNFGGAIHTSDVGQLTVLASTFENCAAPIGGSALDVASNRILLELASCTFRNCSGAQVGGAVALTQISEAAISHCVFEDNSIIENGGALYIYDSSDISIQNTTFTNGTALLGGGVYLRDSSRISFSACSFDSNTASSGGGAIACEGSNEVSMDELCSFSGNEIDDLQANECPGDVWYGCACAAASCKEYACSTDGGENVCYGVPTKQRSMVCLDDAAQPVASSGDGDTDSIPVWAIVLIAVFSALILLVSIGLVALVAASVVLCLRMKGRASYEEV